MRLFHCPACGEQVYFDNIFCLACGTGFGFSPERLTMVLLDAHFRGCARRSSDEACNWVASTHELCRSCELTDASSVAGMGGMRARAERAKRHLLYTLLQFGITFRPKQGAGDTAGLRFVWTWGGPGPEHRTGHDDGTITLDLNETDDAHREAARVAFGEPQRTVLGHLRHELGHHLFQRCIDGSADLDGFRRLFGDERKDYAAALQTHYLQGSPLDWQQHFVSAYASAHPWEDWAESCAHFLLLVDAVETASAWGLELATSGVVIDPYAAAAPIDRLFEHWLPVSRFMNAMARSFGLNDSYQYPLPGPVIDKLRFIQSALTRLAVQDGGGTCSS